MTNEKSKVNPVEIVATLRDVTVTYDGYQTRALSHVDLDVRRGEVMGVLGVKGAGKSTVLKVLAGRVGATEGKVKVFGGSPRGTAKSRVGYLPGKSDASRAGFIDRLLGKKPKAQLSVRGVARLAQAMLGNRDLLVLDEPFIDLEPAELAEAKALIRDMAGRGKTIVLSSESLMAVKDLCGRLAIVHEGRVQAVGTLTELLASGGAIRFLPAVLPKEMVERVLAVLCEEILTSCPAAPVANENVKPPARAQEAAERTPKDSIDHGKLEQLTKTKKPE